MHFRLSQSLVSHGGKFNKLEKFSVYRHIQRVANLCNEVQQKILVPSMIAASVILLGVSLAFLINTPATSANAPVLMIMMIVCVDTSLVLVFGLRGFAQIYEGSGKILHQVRCGLLDASGRKKRKWIIRFVKSCGVIRMKFGGNNFVEKLTPLCCICQAIQIAIQILLME